MCRGARFAREEREGIGGENERKSLTGCEGMEVVMQTVSGQERIEGGEVSEKMGLQDGTREKSSISPKSTMVGSSLSVRSCWWEMYDRRV